MFPKHNEVTESKDHYISYNFGDRSAYGSDTTAIVIGQMQRFYILNGNHVDKLKGKSFLECMEYFNKNSDLVNKYSNKYNDEDAQKVIVEYTQFKKKQGYV
jgi:hypothetical protein